MKLSNKILIGFFGLIFLYITAAFTELRVRGISYNMDNENSIAESVDITGVTHLTLPNLGERVNVIASDTARLEVRSNNGDLMEKLKYRFDGENLTLESLDLNGDQAIRISIYLPKQSLQDITANGASLMISGFERNVLHITQHNGWIRMTEKNQIGKLILRSSYAYFNFSESGLDSLSMDVSNSEVSVDSPVKFLEGHMSDTSYLRMHGIDEIFMKKDKSSRLYLD